MNTICLKTNQNRLIANLRHAFNPSSMLGELLQNARRAQARHILVTVEGDTLTVSDDGIGITDLQTLIFIAESGWDDELQIRENAFGLGVLSTLYFSERLSVHSLNQAFTATTAAIIRGEAITVDPRQPRAGTEIHLEGVSTQSALPLLEWAENQLKRLCEAFPVPVSLNGIDIARPLADASLPWRQSAMGRVLLNLQASQTQWRCFLQGLPIGRLPIASQHQIVELPDDTLAKLPDRQHLLNEEKDHKRIQAAICQVFREALCEKKAQLAASDFVQQYAEICLESANADLLNDMHFLPRSWFRDWLHESAGFRRYWDHYYATGLISRDVVEELGVWIIETAEDDEPTAEVYLEAAQTLLLQEHRLHSAHWLKQIIKTVDPEEIQIKTGDIRYRDSSPGLADYEVELALVDTLHVGLPGEPEHEVKAIRKGSTLYLTPAANAPTELVCDYIFEDRYEEDREDEDARAIATFIAVGSSDSPAHVLDALLPAFLRYTAQAKLANATLSLTFNEQGQLKSVR